MNAMTTSITAGLRSLRRWAANTAMLNPRDREDRNARLLYLNTALVGVESGGILAFLAVFLARLGASSTLVGWLTSAPALLAVLLLIPGAMIAERYTDQVKVRNTFVAVVRLAFLLCAVAPWFIAEEHLPLVLVIIWTLKTLPDVVAIPSWTSVMARAVSPRRRAQINGTRWALLSVVSAGCSAGFGWLLDQIAFPLNYQLVFLISFALSSLDMVFFARVEVPPLERPDLQQAGTGRERFVEYLRPVVHYRPFLVFLSATILYRLALNLPVPLFSLFWVNELHAPDTLIGLRGTVGYAALVAGYTIWGRLTNRLGHRRVLRWSAFGLGLYPILTALSPSAGWLLPVAAVWGITVAGVDIGLFDLMLAACPEHRQPLFAAVWSMATNTAIFVGPLLGAALSNATTLATALIIAGVAQWVTTIPFSALPHDV
jgi:MFS family permease